MMCDKGILQPFFVDLI